MKILTKLLLLLISTGMVFQSFSQGNEDARILMKKSMDNGKFKGIETSSTLKIIDKKGRERIRELYMASKSYNKEDMEKRLILFLAPAEVKETGMLVFDYGKKPDDLWIYMPAIRKTRRIVSSEKKKSFMGSEFSNADMTTANLDDYTYKLQGSENVDGTDCWKIESIPVNNEVMESKGYAKEIIFLGKDDNVIRKVIFYDADAELFKTLVARDIKLIDKANGKNMAMFMLMENHQNERKSEIHINKVKVNEALED
ncbi:MAG: outer membrane lipoprotein-sorting protein, partial [Bacteroidales bacterium]|nr:outer membrane lipoprotein-sorting protein [Bacteroidales bacterium]